MSENIVIDDFELPVGAGETVKYDAKFSKGQIVGIDLDFNTDDDDDHEHVLEVFARDQVEVTDPFTGRSYWAKPKFKSRSTQSGVPGGWYSAEVVEIEVPPDVKEIELNGQIFQVTNYTEDLQGDNKIYREALLRLSEAEFEQFGVLLKEDSLQVKRIGYDDQPLSLEIGSQTWWSKHTEDGKTYFKQILGLIEPEQGDSKPWFRILHLRMRILREELENAHIRYRALLGLLNRKGLISQDDEENLLTDDTSTLLDDDIVGEIQRHFTLVNDAETLFGD